MESNFNVNTEKCKYIYIKTCHNIMCHIIMFYNTYINPVYSVTMTKEVKELGKYSTSAETI